jgi:ADP-heptose:LPS heptosyltransferase
LAKRGYTILLTGSVEEAALLEQVDDLMDQPALNLVDQCGHVGLGELAALIRDSLMLISNDTGVSHLAAAFQIPSVIIFSPFSDMRRWAPLDTQLHLSISPSQAQDPRYVTEVVIEYLEEFSLSVV